MQIQKIEFPVQDKRESDKMYLRVEEGCCQVEKDGSLQIGGLSELRFDTYFNAFSVEKWRHYTKLTQVDFCFEASGSLTIQIWNAFCADGERTERAKIAETVILDNERREYNIEIPLDSCEHGIIYTVIKTQDTKGAIFYKGCYVTGQEMEREVFLALAICTYKRENYLYRNLKLIREKLWENSESCLYHKIDTFVIDNGRTIPQEKVTDGCTLFPNKNAGGTSGFARGMLEAQRRGMYTHILLMDDDVEIRPSALERTYVLLGLVREEYLEAIVGGAMLRMDYEFMQHESGGCYVSGKMISLQSGVDLRKPENVVKNECSENADYNAWWYCCIPMSLIEKKGMPLPLFVHMDDVEYGLRCKAEIIRMNGICVWHETFEHKRPSANEYYDIRNMLIIDAMHDIDPSGRVAFRSICKRMLVNLFRYRYRDIRLMERAVEDFLRGPEWLMAQDAEVLHQEILQAGYRYEEVYCGVLQQREKKSLPDVLEGRYNSNQIQKRKLFSLNGWLLPAERRQQPYPVMAGESPHACYRKRRIWMYDPDTMLGFYSKKEIWELFRLLGSMVRTGWHMLVAHKRVCKSYQVHREWLCSSRFWSDYLRLGGE